MSTSHGASPDDHVMDQYLSVPSPMAQADDPAAADAARLRLRPKKSILSLLSLPSLRRSSRRLSKASTASLGANSDAEGSWAGRGKGKGKERAEVDEVEERSIGRDIDGASVATDFVKLDDGSTREHDSSYLDDETKDVYRWAMVYENQRG